MTRFRFIVSVSVSLLPCIGSDIHRHVLAVTFIDMYWQVGRSLKRHAMEQQTKLAQKMNELQGKLDAQLSSTSRVRMSHLRLS